MADPQVKTDNSHLTGSIKSDENVQIKSPSLKQRWHDFWRWRSGPRIMWALILAFIAILAILYMALSAKYQTLAVSIVQSAFQWMGQSLGATSLRMIEIVILVVSLGACVALLFSPASATRAYRYPFPPASATSHTTVLLDTENIAAKNEYTAQLDSILIDLWKMLHVTDSGRARKQADLLFFMDAKHLLAGTSSPPEGVDANWQNRINFAYNKLIASGFRLINSPHNPTGTKRAKGSKRSGAKNENAVKEAADREIEFLAFERALLHKEKLKFIIMSGDGDFAPLIYHLSALGHEVEIWQWGGTKVYNEMAKNLPSLVVVSYPRPNSNNTNNGAENLKFEFPQPGMHALYTAIDKTVELCQLIEQFQGTVDEKVQILHISLNSTLQRSLSKLGFSAKSYSLSWQRMLYAVDALTKTRSGFPERGATAAPLAARRLYAMALAGAQAAVRAALDHPADPISMKFILAQLVAPELAVDDAIGLQTLLSEERNPSESDMREVDTFFLTHCARALDLLLFDDIPNSRDLIRNPRLTDLAKRIISENAGQPA